MALGVLGSSYDSQATQHVGYLISSVLGYFVPWSLVFASRWFSSLPECLTFSLVVLFLVLGILYSLCVPVYLLVRVQYYSALSEIVWEHMGLKNSNLWVRKELKTRVFQRAKGKYPGTHGIVRAIVTLFEARLYLSMRTNETNEWKNVFVVSDRLARAMGGRSYTGNILWILPRTRLLRLAHRREIKSYLNSYKDKKKKSSTEAFKIGELFNSCLHPNNSE